MLKTSTGLVISLLASGFLLLTGGCATTSSGSGTGLVGVGEFPEPDASWTYLKVKTHQSQIGGGGGARGFAVLKGRDADLRFVFLTGVSKFSKVSLFSGLNNLYDLTLDASVATICGYTEEDLDTVFAPEFTAAAQEGRPLSREMVRDWYSGYSWGGSQRARLRRD